MKRGFSGKGEDEEEGNMPAVPKGNEMGGKFLSSLLFETV